MSITLPANVKANLALAHFLHEVLPLYMAPDSHAADAQEKFLEQHLSLLWVCLGDHAEGLLSHALTGPDTFAAYLETLLAAPEPLRTTAQKVLEYLHDVRLISNT